jgi:hypothetical protein
VTALEHTCATLTMPMSTPAADVRQQNEHTHTLRMRACAALTMPMSMPAAHAWCRNAEWNARRTGSLPRKLNAMLLTPPLILQPGQSVLRRRVALHATSGVMSTSHWITQAAASSYSALDCRAQEPCELPRALSSAEPTAPVPCTTTRRHARPDSAKLPDKQYKQTMHDNQYNGKQKVKTRTR